MTDIWVKPMNPDVVEWMRRIDAKDKLLIRVPIKEALVKDDCVWVNLGQKDDALRQILLASVSEGKAVVRAYDEQDEEE